MVFNSKKWNQNGDFNFPYRKKMAQFILRSNLFIGDNIKSLNDSLGKGQIDSINSRIEYITFEEYGTIDPVYSEKIIFKFNKDSIITKCFLESFNF